MPSTAVTTAPNPRRDHDAEVTLSLAASDVQVVADALTAEWVDLVTATAADLADVVGGVQRPELQLADAAAKVRRQARIADVLAQLGETA